MRVMMWALVIVSMWLVIGAVTAVCIVLGLRRVDAEQAAAELAVRMTDDIPTVTDDIPTVTDDIPAQMHAA